MVNLNTDNPASQLLKQKIQAEIQRDGSVTRDEFMAFGKQVAMEQLQVKSLPADDFPSFYQDLNNTYCYIAALGGDTGKIDLQDTRDERYAGHDMIDHEIGNARQILDGIATTQKIVAEIKASKQHVRTEALKGLSSQPQSVQNLVNGYLQSSVLLTDSSGGYLNDSLDGDVQSLALIEKLKNGEKLEVAELREMLDAIASYGNRRLMPTTLPGYTAEELKPIVAQSIAYGDAVKSHDNQVLARIRAQRAEEKKNPHLEDECGNSLN